MRGLLHDLLSRFVFQLNLTPPWGLLTALCGCQLRFTKRCAHITWRHLKLGESARPAQGLPFIQCSHNEVLHCHGS